jgi:Tol biopolymer transport system component
MVAEVHEQGRANVVIRDVATGRKTATLRQITGGDTLYRDGVRLGWSPDGRLVAVAAYEKRWRPTIRIVEARSGRLVRRLKADARLSPGSFTADGRKLAFVAGKRVVVANLRTGAVRSVPGWGRGPQEVAWSPDGTRLAIAARRGLAVIDPATGEGATRRYADAYAYDSLAWIPDGTQIVYGLRRSEGATVMVADATGTTPPRTLVPWRDGDIHGLRLSPAGDRIALTFWPTA